MSLYYVDAMTQVAVYSIVALGLGVLVGRVGLVSLGQVAVLAIGAWVAARLLFATSLPYLLVLLEAGLITMVARHVVGLPALRHARPVPGADHADAGGRDHGRARHGELPQRRPRLPRLQRQPGAHPADPPAQHRRHRPGLLPLLRDRRGRSCSCWCWRTSGPSRAGPGRRSARASPRRWRPASTPRCTSCGRSRWPRSSPASPAACWPALQYLYSIDFPTQDSITLLAVVLMGGAYSLWGAVVAGDAAPVPAGAAQQLGRLGPTG